MVPEGVPLRKKAFVGFLKKHGFNEFACKYKQEQVEFRQPAIWRIPRNNASVEWPSVTREQSSLQVWDTMIMRAQAAWLIFAYCRHCGLSRIRRGEPLNPEQKPFSMVQWQWRAGREESIISELPLRVHD